MTPATIIRTTAKQHGTTVERILSADRSEPIAYARAEAMTTMRKDLKLRLKDIGEHFGRNFSSVHAILKRHKVAKRPDVIKPTIRGVTYASVAAAADALGVARGTIYEARKRGTLDNVGAGTGNHDKHRAPGFPKPFSIGTHHWPSMSQASLALGFNRDHIGNVMLRGSEAQKRAVVRRYMEWARSDHAIRKGAGA